MEKRPVAYQLYSAREEAAKNLDAVLAAVSEMGYDGVEFAGFYGLDADTVRMKLEKNGLQAVSSHVPMQLIEKDMFGTIAFHKQVGCAYIAIPYLDDEMRPGGPRFARALQTIGLFGRLCRMAGITLLYHNHDFEFVTVSGQYGLDFLYSALPAEYLQSEIDVCWVKYAGVCPEAYLRQYKGRCPVVHLKDYVGTKGEAVPYGLIGKEEKKAAGTDGIPFEFRPFGHGCQDVQGVLTAAIESGAEWFVVEQDLSVGRTPLEAARMSIDTLRQAGVKR